MSSIFCFILDRENERVSLHKNLTANTQLIKTGMKTKGNKCKKNINPKRIVISANLKL